MTRRISVQMDRLRERKCTAQASAEGAMKLFHAYGDMAFLRAYHESREAAADFERQMTELEEQERIERSIAA